MQWVNRDAWYEAHSTKWMAPMPIRSTAPVQQYTQCMFWDGDNRYCTGWSNHEGEHAFFCGKLAPDSEYECPHYCQQTDGHQGPHMATHIWESE